MGSYLNPSKPNIGYSWNRFKLRKTTFSTDILCYNCIMMPLLPPSSKRSRFDLSTQHQTVVAENSSFNHPSISLLIWERGNDRREAECGPFSFIKPIVINFPVDGGISSSSRFKTPSPSSVKTRSGGTTGRCHHNGGLLCVQVLKPRLNSVSYVARALTFLSFF